MTFFRPLYGLQDTEEFFLMAMLLCDYMSDPQDHSQNNLTLSVDVFLP